VACDVKPILIIDGARFDDLEGFAREFSSLLENYRWQGNLDAFSDILRGGFGTPEGGFVLRWLDSDRSRTALGHVATTIRLEGLLRTCHSSNVERISARLDDARRGVGSTLFDEIVEIIQEHGPGGIESGDAVDLELR